MLKRIDVYQVRAGMFVEAVEGIWQDPFLKRRRFFLREEAEVQRLKVSGAKILVINTSKGLDVTGTSATQADGEATPVPGDRAEADSRAARRAIQQSVQSLGHIFDQLHAGSAVSIDQVTPVAAEISKSIDRNPSVFVSVSRLKSKDEVTFLHSISVSGLMIHFARHLGLGEATAQHLGVAGLLHDVGKLEIPHEILNKEGALDDYEIRLIRAHPTMGHAILSRQEGMSDLILDVCLNHHERIDGKGYPGRLLGKEISFYARLAAICDVYEAVTSVRPYKRPWLAADALKWMMQSEGHFDRLLLKKFTLCLAEIS